MIKENLSTKEAQEIAYSFLSFVNDVKVKIEIHLNSLIDEDERETLFLKTEFNPVKMAFNVMLYNSITKTMALKEYALSRMLTESQQGFFLEAIKLDVSNLYKTSKKKFHKIDTVVKVS